MEIFIVGGIVVVIMVIVSTQIKKSAARAFEREIIETEDFAIVKPEGFINPLREDSKYAFEAYSKEFGENDERNTWRAQIYLTVAAGLKIAAICEAAKLESDKILSEKILKNSISDEKICLIESEKIEEEIEFYEFRKIVESENKQKTYDLRISVLKSFRDQFSDRINELENSFRLK